MGWMVKFNWKNFAPLQNEIFMLILLGLRTIISDLA